MSKKFLRILAVICVVSLTCLLLIGVAGATGTNEQAEEVPLYVEGIRVGSGFIITDTEYVPFRALCDALGHEVTVSWDSNSKIATAEMPGLIVIAQVGSKYITANGRYFYAPSTVSIINGAVYVPLDVLTFAFNLDIIRNEEHRTIDISTSKLAPIVSGDEFYNEEDLYWLSRVINAESGNQSLEGKMGVGDVVINRVANQDPYSFAKVNTIREVIFQHNQFDVVSRGTINNEPNAESVIAAKLCLEGYNIVKDSLYFANPTIADMSFFYGRTFFATIGDHAFYL